MSEGTQNIGDEQPVVGEPASHPHQAVVVGEPPETADPVLGEPAFANGLQDQQPILPPSAEDTSANGVQSVSHTPPSPHVSTPVEESPDLQHVPSAEAGETDTHHLEPSVAENSGLSGVSGASDARVFRSTAGGTLPHSAEEESGADFTGDVEVTHIVDSPSQVTPSLSDALSENRYAALDEEEDSEIVPGENPTGNSASADGAPTSNASSTQDEISKKGLGDQRVESTAQDKSQVEDSHSIQTDTEGGSQAANENVFTVETDQGGQGDVEDQKTDSKEANFEKEGSPSHELDQESERATKHTAPEPETAARDEGNSLGKEADKREASTLELPTSKDDKADENDVASRDLEFQSKEKARDEIPPVDSSVGTRDIAVEDGLVTSAANSHQLGDGGMVDREQDLLKADDGASSESEQSGFRSKLPLIFTGLAIAAVGVVVASISRRR